MPKTDKPTARPAGKADAAKKKLTPEQKLHEEQVANIKRAATVPAALVQWTELRNCVGALSGKKAELDAEYRTCDGLRKKAADAQDYALAQVHKEKQDAIQKESADITQSLKPLVDLCEAARTHHTELFLADEHAPYNREETVTLYRIQVINPETQNDESVYYLEGSDTVSLHLDGESFSSEAYHLGTWAEEKGFIVRKVERPIAF
jgi:hypothetical protein